MGLGFAGKKGKRIEGIGLVMDWGCRSGDPEESEGDQHWLEPLCCSLID